MNIEMIIELLVIPIMVALGYFVSAFLRAKGNEIMTKTDNEIAKKYISMITETVANCVTATNQTYTESLKQTGSFNKDAQKEAFQRTFNAAMAILSKDAKLYIQEMTGDLNTYLTQLIEAEVNRQK